MVKYPPDLPGEIFEFLALLSHPRLVLTIPGVLVENLKGATMGPPGMTVPWGEVSERSEEVVELVLLLWSGYAVAAVGTVAAEKTGTVSMLPPLALLASQKPLLPTAAAAAEAVDELDVPLPVSPPSSSGLLLSESEESPVNGMDRICPAC